VAKHKLKVVLFLITAILMFAWLGCEKESPVESTNGNPQIIKIEVTPDSATPGQSVTFRVFGFDPEDDTLSYSWQSNYGIFDRIDSSFVRWTAPYVLGTYPVNLIVSDGEDTTGRVIDYIVYSSLNATITNPASDVFFVPGDTISFTGTISGYDDFNILEHNVYVVWESLIGTESRILQTMHPDTSGFVTFDTTLSYNRHEIILTATISDTIISADTIVVNYNRPTPVTLYNIEREYTKNRLTWTRFDEPNRFNAYLVRRSAGEGVETTIASVNDVNQLDFEDTTAAIGQPYTYRIFAENQFSAVAESEAKSITTGITTTIESLVGDFGFGDNIYLYATLHGSDEVIAIDVTANVIDYTIPVGPGPFGLGFNRIRNRLYVANSNDSTLSVINMLSKEVVDTINIIDNNGVSYQPLLLDIHDFSSQIYITTLNNSYPVAVDDNLSGVDIEVVEDSRLIIDSSFVLVDDSRQHLYIGEVGGYPASIFKYSTTTLPPTFLAEDPQNSLGYDLQDIDILPNGDDLYVACTSPYEIQIVNPETLTPHSMIDTGPYPNSVEISPDGLSAYVSLSDSTVTAWNLNTYTKTRTYHFKDPVERDGVIISPDGNYIAVLTRSSDGTNSTIAIIYLPAN
jgi:YVTN family beta-propeller protein